MSPSATPATLCVVKLYVGKLGGGQVVCEYKCVDKLYVSKLCVDTLCVDKLCVSKLCVSKLCVSKLRVGERRREAGGGTKNKTPHKDVGNYFLQK